MYGINNKNVKANNKNNKILFKNSPNNKNKIAIVPTKTVTIK